MRRLKSVLTLLTGFICILACPLHAQQPLPVGTVIAIVLEHTIDSRSVKPGRRIVARIAQEVPLGDKHVIRAGSKVFGEVTQTENVLGHAKLGLRFDRLELGNAEVVINTRLRALASSIDVSDAKLQRVGAGESYRSSDTTVQIGGRVIVYRGGGVVENEKGEVVGQPVSGGVLAVVTNQPGSNCESIPVTQTPQAVWLFAPNACDVYGFRGVRFENGTGENAGEILLLKIDKKDWKFTSINLTAGSALLLTIAGTPGR